MQPQRRHATIFLPSRIDGGVGEHEPEPHVPAWFGRVYVAVSILLWPVTTIISTAYALKLKIPALPDWRRPRLRDQAARG